MATELHFKTNTLLKNLVGKDLINDDGIAIVELVKNAFDAQSPSVLVQFDNLTDEEGEPCSSIVIADSGTGMTLADIKDKWLNIAYSEKKNSKQSTGAHFAGNKGVGRFSCDRLGSHLDLVTRVKSGKLLHLPIDWTDFEVEGKKDRLIQDIPLYISVISEAKAAKILGQSFPAHGTALVIKQLRSAWDRSGLLELKRALEKFLHPNQLFQRKAFQVKLSAPSQLKADKGKNYYEQVNGEVKNQVFEKLKFNSTFIEAKVSNKGQIATELVHDGEAVFRLVENASQYSGLGDVSIIIYYLNPYKKAYFTRQAGMRAVDFGSIFLFLNGFRVSPYGDRGDDWLGLDVRKAQGISRYLGSRDLVGRIEVIDTDDRYTPVSSREGLKNTPEFSALRRGLFLEVLRRLERFVVQGLDWDSVPGALRDELRTTDGLDWTATAENYLESWDRKKRRIGLSILDLVGGSPDTIQKIWFNPRLLDELATDRSSELTQLLADIEGIDPKKVDGNLKAELSKIHKFVTQKESQLTSAKKEAADLRVAVAEHKTQLRKVTKEKETFRAQTLFLQSIGSHEVKNLLAFHHQINHDSMIAGNYISTAMRELRKLDSSSNSPALVALQKAALANQRIAAVARFATKANFRAGMKKEVTDLAAFFDQYIRNIAKDFSASGLQLTVRNSVQESFELKASRIELSILIDNIINNATKALARSLTVTIDLISKNKLGISFLDDGRGLSADLPSIDAMFELGITTTQGSGLGLFHAKRIADDLGAVLSAKTRSPKGMEIRLEVGR